MQDQDHMAGKDQKFAAGCGIYEAFALPYRQNCSESTVRTLRMFPMHVRNSSLLLCKRVFNISTNPL